MAEATSGDNNQPQPETTQEAPTSPENNEVTEYSFTKISQLIEAKSALDDNEANVSVRESLSSKIDTALSQASAKIFEKLGRGERVSEEEHLLLVQDLTERSERSALANCFLATQGLNTFQEAMGKANVKSVKNEELEVALDKQHKNPWIKEQLKKMGISAGLSAATLGVVSLLGGPVTWLGFAAGVGGGALGRFVGEKLRQRSIGKDGINEKMILELLDEITLLRSKAKDVLSSAENQDERAEKINDLLRNVFERQKLDSVVNYSRVDSRARKISAGLGFIGAVGSSLASSALVHASDVANAMTQAKSEGVRIFHDAAGAHLSLDPSVGHEVYQTNDGVWRFMIEQKDLVTAQEHFGPNWSDWLHVVGAEGSKGDVISAPTLEKLQEIAAQHDGLSMLFHNSSIAEESVRTAINQKVTSLTNLALMVGGASVFGHSVSEALSALKNKLSKDSLKRSNQQYYQTLQLPAEILEEIEETATPEPGTEEAQQPESKPVIALDDGDVEVEEVNKVVEDLRDEMKDLIPIMNKPVWEFDDADAQKYSEVFKKIQGTIISDDNEQNYLGRLSNWIESTIGLDTPEGQAIRSVYSLISTHIYEAWYVGNQVGWENISAAQEIINNTEFASFGQNQAISEKTSSSRALEDRLKDLYLEKYKNDPEFQKQFKYACLTMAGEDVRWRIAYNRLYETFQLEV